MQKIYIPYREIDYLSSSDKAYAEGDAALHSFYKYEVNLDSFAQVIEDKKQDNTNRELLYNVITSQYSTVNTSDSVRQNIEKLKAENTFTVITAHQPSLFTGPLYFIYKSITAINLAKKLNATYSDYQFVPVFYLGSEDHDFEEINHFNIFGKSVTWENNQAGATGMMEIDSLSEVLAQTKEILGNSDNATQIYNILKRCFSAGKTYAQATFEFVNELFKAYGLVVALTNNADLKRLFIPYIKEELLHQPSKALIEAEQTKIEAAGFKGQAFAREINFFYMVKGSRERIVFEDGKYQVLNRDLSFSKEEMLAELEAHPERFSPNVVMRPIYQEVIFPNLCYIGGGGELAYWRERMTQFEHFQVNFPMLMRRNSVKWIDKGNQKKLDKLGLSVQQIFGETEALIKEYVRENTTEELSLKEEKANIQAAFDSILAKAINIEKNLERPVIGEMTKIMKSVDKLEAKLISTEKKKYDTAIKQIRTLKDKLFPKNGLGLQERHDNFLQFYLRYGDDFIKTLVEHQDALNKDFLVLVEE